MNYYNPSIYGRFKRYWYDSLYLQCIFTVVWLPIGAYFGMGSAWFSIIGNLFFGLLAHIFLWLSSIVFFSTIVGIPCVMFTPLLTLLTKIWLSCMNYAPHHAMAHYPQPSLFYLFMFMCSFILILHNRLLRNHIIVCLVVLLGAFLLTSYTFLPSNKTRLAELPFLKKNITFLDFNATCLIDQAALGSSINSPAHLEYNFLPMLHKRYGSKRINHCIVLQPSFMTFKALLTLCQLGTVDSLYIPYWKDSTSSAKNKQLHNAFYQLKKYFEQQGGKLHRLAKENIEIILEAHHVLTLSNTNTMITKNGLNFPLFECIITTDNHA